MATFAYTALDSSGRERKGTLEADNRRTAAQKLRTQGVFTISLEDSAARELAALAPPPKRRMRLPFTGTVGPKDRIFLYRQLALMLAGGHTVVQALDALQQLTDKASMRDALLRMSARIRDGEALSQTIKDEKVVFPSVVAQIIESGERSGSLDPILERLAEDEERQRAVRQRVTTALAYPTLVFVAAIAVTIALVGWVIPRFALFLTARDVELPPITQLLLDVSGWLTDNAAVLAVVTLLVLAGLVLLQSTQGGRLALDRLVLRTPIIGPTVASGSLAQLSWSLAMQLRSGLTLLDSIRISRGATPNTALAYVLDRAGERLLDGQPLSRALSQPLMPSLVAHMASVGERSGELDNVMDLLGSYYQKDLETRVETMSTWVEPVMILVVGGMVGLVYLAFFQAALRVSTGGI